MGKVIYLTDPETIYMVDDIEHIEKLREIRAYERKLINEGRIK